jgi:hypothetical protein
LGVRGDGEAAVAGALFVLGLPILDVEELVIILLRGHGVRGQSYVNNMWVAARQTIIIFLFQKRLR